MFSENIFSELGLKVKVAGEIEFYIEPAFASEDIENDFQSRILKTLAAKKIAVWKMDKEVSPSQYEIALQPTTAKKAADNLSALKDVIQKAAKELNTTAIFSAKPYNDLPGCGLHIHIGLTNNKDESMLGRWGEKGQKDSENDLMLHAIGGLCSTMLMNFSRFAPSDESYLRFSAKRNIQVENPLAIYNNAPVNVSWGGNNRTTAIRIPASSYDESSRHIEHRVSGADADPELVIDAILEGVYIGIKHKINPPQKIHGNAFDKQYSFLVPFPKTLAEAKKLNKK